MIRKAEKIVGIHDDTSKPSVNHISDQAARLMRVSSFLGAEESLSPID
jgi:hypothetical protein